MMRWFVGVVAAVSILATACGSTGVSTEPRYRLYDGLPYQTRTGIVDVERDDGTTVECTWWTGGGLSCNWEAANKLPASVDR